jgi:Cu2+-exporting ATPase
MTSARAGTNREPQQCFHCGEEVPPDSRYAVIIHGEPRAMCCTGCQAVAQAIVDGGLESFYDHRTALSRRAEDLIPEQLRRFDLYDQPKIQESFVAREDAASRSASLILEGITCAACVWLSERHVRELEGVAEFNVNYSTHRARVRWDDGRIHLSDILRAIAAIGYVAHPFDPGRQEELYKKEKSRALRRLAIAGLGAMQVMMLAVPLYAGDHSDMEEGMRRFLRWVSLVLTVPVVFYSAQEFFRGAWRDLRLGRPGMDVPVSLAVGGAFTASVWATLTGGLDVYFESVCMFTFFLLTSRYLEMGARHRAGQAAEALVRLLPATATRLGSDGAEAVVAVAELATGDRLRVRPGETVPADGIVAAGRSSVDESLLTGESLPCARGRGDSVIGGSVNVESPLEITVTRVGEDTVVSGIVRLLDRAQAEKPRLARLADEVAAWFVSGMLAVAGGVALWWWLHDAPRTFAVTLSVLVVSCPCALSLATPVAITAATGALTRRGLLTTRGHALETLARATHVVFDKTGTLTRGVLTLERVLPRPGMQREEALALAAALERHSEHPVGQILAAAGGGTLAASEVVAVPGEGVEGVVAGRRYRVGSPVFAAALSGCDAPGPSGGVTRVALGDQQGIAATFELSDELRADAVDALRDLRGLGLQVALLSGDAEPAVQRIARALAIDRFTAAAKPADKLAHIRRLQAAGGVVAMIGDGVNDAPVLAGSDVSVAMGSGTQIAHASADLVMLSEHLAHLASGVRMARRTLLIIRQNLAWAVLYNVIAIPLAAAGWVAPWMAAIGMSASSLVVVVNALRLRRVSP